jgi:hypothetical protein
MELKNRIKMSDTSCMYDAVFETRKWCKEIPYINFKEEWKVKIIHPFCAATVRFLVAEEGKEGNRVSVYLDCYSMLGCMDEPYWEVYPYDGDTFRCKMNDTKALLDAIKHSLKNDPYVNLYQK